MSLSEGDFSLIGRTEPSAFPSLWKVVTNICSATFKKLDHRSSSDLVSEYNALVISLCEAHGVIYQLTAFPCNEYPALVRGTNAVEVRGKTSESTQVLVVFYLLREFLKHQINCIKANIDPEVIDTYLDAYDKYTAGTSLVKAVFTYLHWTWQKYGLPCEHVIQPTEVVSLHLWTEAIFNGDLRDRFRNKIDDTIRSIRKGDPTDIREMESIKRFSLNIGSLTDSRMTLYSSVVEEPYLRSLANFYAPVKVKLKRRGVAEYVGLCKGILKKEEFLARCFLIKSSYDQVRNIVLKILVDSEMDFLRPFCKNALDPSDGNDPTQHKGIFLGMYELLNGDTNESWMRELLKETISEYVSKELQNMKDGFETSTILEILQRTQRIFEKVVLDIFGNCLPLIRAVHEGIAKGFEQWDALGVHADNASRTAKRLVRLTAEEIQTAPIAELLRRDCWIAVAYRHLSRSDVFHQFYTKFLEERLLAGIFRGDENANFILREESMLSTLLVKDKNFGFVFNCMKLIRDVTRDKNCETVFVNGIRVTTNILTAYAWGETRASSNARLFAFPPELRSFVQGSIDAYAALGNGRRLVFSHEYSGANVQMRVPGTTSVLRLTVSFLQLRFLYVMNRMQDRLLSRLCTETNTTKEACWKVLQPFVQMKIVSLNEREDLFFFTPQYVTPTDQNLIDLRQVEVRLHQANSEKNHLLSKAEKDHGMAIEGHITKHLKESGPLSMEVILGKVSGSLSTLQIQRKDIKRAIEKLVERECVGRSDDNFFSFIP